MMPPSQYFLLTPLLLAVLPLHAQPSAQFPAQAPAQQPQEPMTVIQVNVNSVLVPVVVRDSQGHAIGDLKQADFKIFDQGKPRQLAGFTVLKGEPIHPQQLAPDPAVAAPDGPASLPANAAASSGAPAPGPDQRAIDILIDDRHLSVADLVQTKKAILQLLDQPLTDGSRILLLSFLGLNSGLTHNRTPLKAALEKLKARDLPFQTANQCPFLDYYQADQILNKDNRTEYGIAMEKAAKCLHIEGASANGDISIGEVSKSLPTAQAQTAVQNAATIALQEGETDARETLAFLRDVVHTVSSLPGQRTLILASPGFFAITQETGAIESQLLNMAAQAGVTINTLDARGLYGTMMGASHGGDESMRSLVNGQNQNDRNDSMRQSKQIMAELADGSGGTFFQNSNDLAGGFAALASGPEWRYLIELSLQGVKQNGAYHPLKVEVDRKDAKVEARDGYYALLAPKGRKIERSPGMAMRRMLEVVLPAAILVAVAAGCSAQLVTSLSKPVATAAQEASSYFELPIQRLKSAVPALKGVQYDASQQQLQPVLEGVAAKIANVLPAAA